MIAIPNNSKLGALDTLRTTKMITPVAFNAIGTFANQVNLYIDACIEQVYGNLAPHLPVALRGLDSAQGTKDLKISLPGSPPRPAPPGLVTLYRDHAVPALRAQAERAKGTRPLADKLGQMPAMETLANGCCLKPAFGLAQWLANLQPAANQSLMPCFAHATPTTSRPVRMPDSRSSQLSKSSWCVSSMGPDRPGAARRF